MVSQDKYKQTRYWKKHKRLKACGWTTLGIGVPTMVVGFVGAVVSGYESGGDGEGFGIVICAGAGLTVSSIPLFLYLPLKTDKKLLQLHSAQNLTHNYGENTDCSELAHVQHWA